MPEIRRRQDWDASDLLDVAYLIVTPETNGGVESDLSLLDVYESMPADLPAWAVWEDELICFVVGLIPFDGVRGVLHLAGTGALSHAEHVQVVRAFLGSLPGIEVSTVTDSPAIVRLARQVGLHPAGEQDGQTILRRASQ